MPDSFHPGPWGHQPFDERDLDAVLDGNATDVPVALRPVASALDALLAAPSPAELRGEAAIRAQFLAERQRAAQERVSGGGPRGQDRAPAVPSAVPFQATGTPSVPFPLSTEPIAPRTVPANQQRPRRGRHSRRGSARPGASRAAAARARRHRRSRITAAVTAGAAFAVLLTATYTGALPGPVQRLAHMTIAAPTGRSYAGSTPGPGVEATSASAAPSTGITRAGAPSAARPAPTASPSVTPDQVALCDAFLPVAEHPPSGQESWQSAAYARLVAAAGGPRQVYSYCAPVWDKQFPSGYLNFPAYPPYFPHAGGGKTGTDSGGGSGAVPGETGQQPGGWTAAQEPTQAAQPTPVSRQDTGGAMPTPNGVPDQGQERGAGRRRY